MDLTSFPCCWWSWSADAHLTLHVWVMLHSEITYHCFLHLLCVSLTLHLRGTSQASPALTSTKEHIYTLPNACDLYMCAREPHKGVPTAELHRGAPQVCKAYREPHVSTESIQAYPILLELFPHSQLELVHWLDKVQLLCPGIVQQVHNGDVGAHLICTRHDALIRQRRASIKKPPDSYWINPLWLRWSTWAMTADQSQQHACILTCPSTRTPHSWDSSCSTDSRNSSPNPSSMHP